MASSPTSTAAQASVCPQSSQMFCLVPLACAASGCGAASPCTLGADLEDAAHGKPMHCGSDVHRFVLLPHLVVGDVLRRVADGEDAQHAPEVLRRVEHHPEAGLEAGAGLHPRVYVRRLLCRQAGQRWQIVKLTTRSRGCNGPICSRPVMVEQAWLHPDPAIIGTVIAHRASGA